MARSLAQTRPWRMVQATAARPLPSSWRKLVRGGAALVLGGAGLARVGGEGDQGRGDGFTRESLLPSRCVCRSALYHTWLEKGLAGKLDEGDGEVVSGGLCQTSMVTQSKRLTSGLVSTMVSDHAAGLGKRRRDAARTALPAFLPAYPHARLPASAACLPARIAPTRACPPAPPAFLPA